LTDTPSTLHDELVRRFLAFALVFLLALSLPLRQGGVSERETSPSKTEASASTQGSSRPTAVVPHLAAGATGASQGRLAPDALASASWSTTLPDDSRSSSVLFARFRLHTSPPLRDFPLLI
jgi:hypothetical protein